MCGSLSTSYLKASSVGETYIYKIMEDKFHNKFKQNNHNTFWSSVKIAPTRMILGNCMDGFINRRNNPRKNIMLDFGNNIIII